MRTRVGQIREKNWALMCEVMVGFKRKTKAWRRRRIIAKNKGDRYGE